MDLLQLAKAGLLPHAIPFASTLDAPARARAGFAFGPAAADVMGGRGAAALGGSH